jgi:hypothetical protein
MILQIGDLAVFTETLEDVSAVKQCNDHFERVLQFNNHDRVAARATKAKDLDIKLLLKDDALVSVGDLILAGKNVSYIYAPQERNGKFSRKVQYVTRQTRIATGSKEADLKIKPLVFKKDN